MKSIWFNNGEKCISFSFDKELVKNFIKVKKTDSIKGLDSIYQYSISIFGLVITYGDFNYNRIIHIMLNHQKDNYTKSSQNHEISVLKETLLSYIKKNFKNVTTPFNWNCSLNKDTGEIIYYITGKKSYFENNNLSDIVNGYIEICGRDNIISNLNRFPKYNIRKHSVIEYITNKKETQK